MENRYKFGDKSFGRSPLERLIILLESNGLLNRVLIVSSTLGLIGVNSFVRSEYEKGLIYFLLVILILMSETRVSENFFGSSALAICIVLHITIFGLDEIPLVLSFIIYIVFRKLMEKHILIPISVYLVIDTIILLSKEGGNLQKILGDFGKEIFTSNFLILLFTLPMLYISLKLEGYISLHLKGKFLKSYGYEIILLLNTLLIFLHNEFSNIVACFSLFLYFITFIATKDDWKKNDNKNIVISYMILGVWGMVVYFLWGHIGYQPIR